MIYSRFDLVGEVVGEYGRKGRDTAKFPRDDGS